MSLRALEVLLERADIPADVKEILRREITDRTQLEALLEAMPDTIYFKDTAGRFTRVNRAQAEVLGISSPEQALGKSDFDFFTPEHAWDAHADEQRIVTSGQAVVNKVERIRRATGEFRWVSATKVPLRDGQGEITGVVGISRDIEDRVRAEEALRHAEWEKVTILDSLPDLVVYQDMDHRILWANRAAADSVGLRREELMGRRCFEVWHASGKPCDPCPIAVAMESKQIAGGGMNSADGRSWVVHGVPVLNAEGQVRGAIEVCRDVTRERAAEEALRASEARYRTIFDLSPQLIALLDIEGRIVDFNCRGQDWVGVTREQAIGQSVFELSLFPEETHQSLRERWAQRLAGDMVVPYRVAFRDREDQERIGRVVGTLLRDENGEPTGALIMIADVTEQERLEAQVQHSQKLESLGVLAGGIAHDFNNLLMGVLGNASLALMQLSPDAPAYSCVEHVQTAALRAAELSKQMLAYSGKGRFMVQPLNLSSLVEELTHLLESSISKKALLHKRLPADLPAIAGDATQLRQIVMNLITNASDALRDDAGVISVSTGTVHVDQAYLASTYIDDRLPAGRYVYLEVSDTGCGMDAETQARMFDPFFTTKPTGRGLGMAAVLGIVRGHEGALKVYSEQGLGTTIKVLFRCIEEPAEALALPEETVTAEHEAWTGAGSVLVADDEEVVRQVARATLELAGFAVIEAEDGQEALDIFRQHADEIVVVLLDLSMPRMGGKEALQAMRLLRPDARIVLSSGFNEQDTISRLAGRRFSGVIQKPYKPTDLIATLRSVLDGREC